jgi:hypothetical protein
MILTHLVVPGARQTRRVRDIDQRLAVLVINPPDAQRLVHKDVEPFALGEDLPPLPAVHQSLRLADRHRAGDGAGDGGSRRLTVWLKKVEVEGKGAMYRTSGP